MQLKPKKAFNINQSFDVQRAKLDNGLVVVTEKAPHVRSVSFGVFLRVGSRHEPLGRHGLTHFIEHALFKGTRKRSASQIAAEADALGGNLDAFTGREIVGFHDKVLDEHLPRAFELIADLVSSPAFDPLELDKERNVILEEIKMVEDTPDDVIFDIFCQNFYRVMRSVARFSASKSRSRHSSVKMFRPGMTKSTGRTISSSPRRAIWITKS